MSMVAEMDTTELLPGEDKITLTERAAGIARVFYEAGASSEFVRASFVLGGDGTGMAAEVVLFMETIEQAEAMLPPVACLFA